MSVIVLGMEMPHKCLECQLNTDEIACTAATLEQSKEAYYEAKKNGTSHEEEMFKICPLRTLPEKHGRLIDADEFGSDYEALYNLNDITNSEWILFREWLKNQKTIVEAEGEDG